MPHHAPPSTRPSVRFLPTLSPLIFDALSNGRDSYGGGIAVGENTAGTRSPNGIIRTGNSASHNTPPHHDRGHSTRHRSALAHYNNFRADHAQSEVKEQIDKEMDALFAYEESSLEASQINYSPRSIMASEVASFDSGSNSWRIGGHTPRGFIQSEEEGNVTQSITLSGISKPMSPRRREQDPKFVYHAKLEKRKSRPVRRYSSVVLSKHTTGSPRKSSGKKSGRRHAAANGIMQVQVKKKKRPASHVKKIGINAGMASGNDTSSQKSSETPTTPRVEGDTQSKASKRKSNSRKRTHSRGTKHVSSSWNKTSAPRRKSSAPRSSQSFETQKSSVTPNDSPVYKALYETQPMKPLLIREDSTSQSILLMDPHAQSARPRTSTGSSRPIIPPKRSSTARSPNIMTTTLNRFNQDERRPQSARNRPRRRFSPNHFVHSLQKIHAQQQEQPLLSFDFSTFTLQEVYANHERRNNSSQKDAQSARSQAPISSVPALNFGVLDVSQKCLSARGESSFRLNSARSKTAQSHRGEHRTDALSLPQQSQSARSHSASLARRGGMALPPGIHFIPFTEIVSESARETPSPTLSRGTPSRTGSKSFLFFHRLLTAEQWRRIFMFLEGRDLFTCSCLCDFFSLVIFHQDFYTQRLQLRKREHMFYKISKHGRTSDVALSRLSELQSMLHHVSESDFSKLSMFPRDKLSLEQHNTVKHVIFVLFRCRMHKINSSLIEKCLQRDDFLDLLLDYDVSEMRDKTFSLVEHFVFHRTEDYSVAASARTAAVDKDVRHVLDTMILWLEIQCQLYKCEKMLTLEQRIKNIEEWMKGHQKRECSRPMVVGDAMTSVSR